MATSQVVGHAEAKPLVRGRLWWFMPVASAGLLAIVLFGFAKTLYLRAFFKVPPIPAYLYVHGVVLTTWYVLVVVQTWLIARHRTDVHRRLGWLGAAVACLLVPISAYVVWQYVPRALARGRPLDAIRGLVAGDLVSLLFFGILVAAAIRFRRRPEVHKRLILASCFSILVPALERFYFSYGLPIRGLPTEPILFYGTLLGYDLLSRRRLHRATLWIVGGGVVLYGVLNRLILVSGLTDSFIAAAR